MGTRKGITLVFLLFCSTMPISSAAALQQQILPTESNYQHRTSIEKHGKDGAATQIDRRYSTSAIAVSDGIRRGSAAAGGGENGGGSTPHAGGGTAVIPVYAAGSAQARHRQGRPHNAGNGYDNNMGLLIAAVLAVMLISIEVSDIKVVSIGTQERCYKLTCAD
ncbi:unnamed protein product [Citrullus colocynthis]|uniref:Glycine-rich protein n=1 Tax=Citrullus colocynthis TaxID=252529 RepID=A0ABP0YF65_9ROSI